MDKHFNKCEKCKEYHWSNEACLPEYSVYYEDWTGDEPKIMHASSHEQAALAFALYYNTRADYALMNETIEIKVVKDGIVKFFCIGAEPDVHYSSTEIPALKSIQS